MVGYTREVVESVTGVYMVEILNKDIYDEIRNIKMPNMIYIYMYIYIYIYIYILTRVV